MVSSTLEELVKRANLGEEELRLVLDNYLKKKKAGTISFEKRKGIHKLVSEEKRKFAHVAGRNSALSRGYVPYEDVKKDTEFGFMDEKTYIITLKLSGQYEFRSGWKDISDLTNARFGNQRSYKHIPKVYYRWSKNS